MAGAEAAVQVLSVEKPEVPQRLLKGSKFLKWPRSDGDDSILAVPITLRVDPKGYLIYWKEPTKDTESLEISSIRDTRHGKYAKEPKQERFDRVLAMDPNLGKMVSSSAPLSERCFTIVSGVNLIDLNFLNFIAVENNPQQVVQEWADYILKLAYHPTTRHISVQTSIEKAFTKLKIETDDMGKIPVKKLVKLLGGKSKRIENALSSVGLPSGSKKSIDPDEFQLARFKKLLQLCCQRQEMDEVFSNIGSGARRMYISYTKVQEFQNTVQRDPKLNEILYPFMTEDQARDLVSTYEPNVMFAQKATICETTNRFLPGFRQFPAFPACHRVHTDHQTHNAPDDYWQRVSRYHARISRLLGHMTQEGFDAYLQSDDNLVVSIDNYAEYQEMNLPLSNYFINSSHNTYLTGTQYRSKSSAEMYRQVLLTGCRCVELDCWEGDDEPYINHGFTFCTAISYKEVIEAINESAFKTSPYPVILSFENHVDNPQQQAKMAQYCRDIFKEKLLVEPLEPYPIEQGKMLPPPKELLYKIIVKNKKQHLAKPAKSIESDSTTNKDKQSRGSTQSEVSLLSSPPAASNGQRDPQRKVSSGSISSLPGKSSRPNTRTNSTNSGANKPILSPLASTSPQDPKEDEDSDSSHRSSVVIEKQEKTKPQKSMSESAITTSNNGKALSDRDHPAPIRENASAPEVASDKVADSLKEEGKAENEKEDEENEEKKNNEDSKEDEDEDIIDEDEGSITNLDYEKNASDCGTASRESRAYEAMSALVNYIEPIRFKHFEFSERRNRSYEISSFTESAALRLLTFNPLEFVRYNRRQTSRIYPKGARVDSSNYMPQLFWNAGCQFVALNFQVFDLPMQLNLGLFEYNGSTGYLVKPEHMRKKDRMFDPFAKNIDGIVACKLTVKIISGQFISQQKLSTYVEVDMFGLPNDTVRKQFKTKTISDNSLNPHYDSPEFKFEKIVLPSLAVLRIAVSDTGGNLVAQRFLKVDGLKPGYRYVTMRNEGNQPLPMTSLFVHLLVEDFVPEVHKDLADWLANPIPYLKEIEREEKEREAREKAIKLLLGPQERVEAFGEDIPALRVDTTDAPAPTKTEKSNSIGAHKTTSPTSPTVRNIVDNNKPNHTEPPQQRKPSVQSNNVLMFMEPFEPQTLNDIKLGKAYQKLERDMERSLTKLREKHQKAFNNAYRILFGDIRRPSVLSAFRNINLGKKSSVDTGINMSQAQSEESKKSELMKLLKDQFKVERDHQIGEIPSYVEKFEGVVKQHQRSELEKLAAKDKSEQAKVQKRKDEEKEHKIKQLSSSLSREELELNKKKINNAHIKECVRDRTILKEKQLEREETTKYQQDEILTSLEKEKKERQQKIEDEYKHNVKNVKQIFESRCQELAPSGSSLSMTGDGPQDGEYNTYL